MTLRNGCRTMICMCGHNLGKVTVRTVGLCPKCNKSIWIQVAEKNDVRHATAAHLNRGRATRCRHGDKVCIARCGVQFEDGTWKPITDERRTAWFDMMLHRSHTNETKST